MSQHKPDDAATTKTCRTEEERGPTGAVPDPKAAAGGKPAAVPTAPEFGGPSGPEPTRYGDWERNGRVSDF